MESFGLTLETTNWPSTPLIFKKIKLHELEIFSSRSWYHDFKNSWKIAVIVCVNFSTIALFSSPWTFWICLLVNNIVTAQADESGDHLWPGHDWKFRKDHLTLWNVFQRNYAPKQEKIYSVIFINFIRNVSWIFTSVSHFNKNFLVHRPAVRGPVFYAPLVPTPLADFDWLLWGSDLRTQDFRWFWIQVPNFG